MTTLLRPARALITASGLTATTAPPVLAVVLSRLVSSVHAALRLAAKFALAAVPAALVVIVPAQLAGAGVGPSWAIQTTADSSGLSANEVNAVSCSSATACMAVGYQMTSNSDFFAMAESWNGRTWTLMPMGQAATSVLEAVSCTSAGACTAVGYDATAFGPEALAERWNGTKWAVQTLPVPPCTIALGRGCDGNPPTMSLNGVSCVSATACMAVGDSSDAAAGDQAIYWNGSTWTFEPISPGPDSTSIALTAVSCGSATHCMAVGQNAGSAYTTAYAELWNGTTWTGTAVPAPDPNGDALTGVSCTSAVACTVVGFQVPASGPDADVPLVEGWNGANWSDPDFPIPSGPSGLNAVSCASATSCVAVGAFGQAWGGNAPGGAKTLSEIWDGTSWRIDYPGNPSPATTSILDGVSCTSAAVCTSVGSWDSQTSTTQGFYPVYTLGERYS